MDPVTALGLVSSIAQIAQVSLQIISVLDTIREGGQERRKLCNEITLLWMTLRNLETQFAPLSVEQNGDWMGPMDSLANHGGVFDQIAEALNEVWNKLTTTESRRAKMVQTLRWPYDKGDVEKTIARIERLKQSVAIVVSQTGVALAKEMQEDTSAVKKIATDNQFKDIIDWLSPLNFRQKQENITGTPGTGGWFFKEEEFELWDSGKEPWLWCYGIPGAGKTVLVSTTVDELRRLHEKENAVVLVAFCSFDNSDSQSVDFLISSFLKQIIQIRMSVPDQLQALYHKHLADNTRPPLSEICNILGDSLSSYDKSYIVLDALDELNDDSKRLTLLETIKGLKGSPRLMVTSRRLESIASRFGYTRSSIYCDNCKNKELGMYHHCDDCPDFDLCEDCFKKGTLCGSDGHNFIKRFSSAKIRIVAQQEDIESYINRRIEIEEDLRILISKKPGLKEQILDTVVEKAKEMFLLAKFHMDSVADCLSTGEVLDALENLPKEIDNTYDQAMMRIEKLSTTRQRAVKKLLQWVTYAERPLKIAELEHATAISRGVKEIRKDYILSAKVLSSLSAGLVIIDESDSIRLTHETAEAYFKSRRETLYPQGEIEIAESCIAYLQLDAFNDGPCTGPDEAMEFEQRWKLHPFLGYAALYWGNHARRSKSEIVTPQALMFLRDESHLAASVQALWYTDIESADSWDVQGDVGALHLSAFFGLNDIVTRLLSEGADVNARDPLGTTPIIYAASKGYVDVVDTLLRSGASASAVDERGSTALHRASKNNDVEVVKRLLREKDVALNELYTSSRNRSALMIACSHGHKEIVKLLLTRSDIDVNQETPTPRGLNALIIAADMDHREIVELLLKHPNIEKDHQDRAGYTAMNYAACAGYVGVVEALLDGGADPEVEDDQGGRPIQRAIDDNEYAVVRLLLQRRVQWNFRDRLGRTLLHSAACNDRTRIIRLLLETCKDLDVNGQGNAGETALHDAARSGFVETCKVLLEFGARTDIKNRGGRTPVRSAKDAGQTEVLEVLREARDKEIHPVHKADTFKITGELPLPLAVQQGDLPTLRARIAAATADELNAFSPDSSDTPLHTACHYLRSDIVELLLDAGAFIDPQDAFHRTPLTLACQGGDLATVKVLVAHGADLNIATFREQPPWEIALLSGAAKVSVYLLAQPGTEIKKSSDNLHRALGWAAALGNLEAAKRLVEAGAPVLLKNADGMTPLQIAKDWSMKEVEAYLFEESARQRASANSSPALPQLEASISSISLNTTFSASPTLVSHETLKVEAVGSDDEKKLAQEDLPAPGLVIASKQERQDTAVQGRLGNLLASRNHMLVSVLLVIMFATLSWSWS